MKPPRRYHRILGLLLLAACSASRAPGASAPGTGGGAVGGQGGLPDLADVGLTGGAPSADAAGVAVDAPEDRAVAMQERDSAALGDALAGPDLPGGEAIARIGFGSCNYVSADQGFWTQIAARKPEIFLFLGDILYLDHGETYAQLSAVRPLDDLLAVTRPFVIWDDHDFGRNDSGAELPNKDGAKAAFLGYWAEHGGPPRGSPRWLRQGNYDSAIVGPAGREVQILMLDNRYWKEKPPGGTVLGDAQWAWLAEELRKPARLRIIMSGMEQISSSTTPEGWGLYPAEQEHLYATLRAAGAKGAIIVSGDKHYLEISRRDVGLGYPLYDFTSSPMSAPPEPPEANKYRDAPGSIISDHNFGMITIDWSLADPTVHVELIHSSKGTLLLDKQLRLSDLGQ
jgi:alkaline phosphatase D